MVNAPLTSSTLPFISMRVEKVHLGFLFHVINEFFQVAVGAFQGKADGHPARSCRLPPNCELMFAAVKLVGGQAGIQVAAEDGEIVHADDVFPAELLQFLRELLPVAVLRAPFLQFLFLELEGGLLAQAVLPRQFLDGQVGEGEQAAGRAQGEQDQQARDRDLIFFHC